MLSQQILKIEKLNKKGKKKEEKRGCNTPKQTSLSSPLPSFLSPLSRFSSSIWASQKERSEIRKNKKKNTKPKSFDRRILLLSSRNFPNYSIHFVPSNVIIFHSLNKGLFGWLHRGSDRVKDCILDDFFRAFNFVRWSFLTVESFSEAIFELWLLLLILLLLLFLCLDDFC